ncbi:hypothetical protein BP6252_11000 [Coleophoma cylindrospora]|uniref:Zn(2)-C6 fungal-type domain-containing protein n=1 Tax=Coleophoma cylindrospora TaxID=1849047 RepID=A0A3D8QNS2_9HELO|nr:hypothetical protein BP6252_11000 [Coleophoma cylindrospora]
MAESSLQPQACILCNRRKKKCSRTFPRCEYCERNGWSCEYPTIRRQHAGEGSGTTISPQSQLEDRRSELESLSISDISPFRSQQSQEDIFPPAFFLDVDLFKQCQLTLPRDFAAIPAYIQPFVGDLTSIRDTAAKYFEKIQPWMPIVAKKRFFRYLLNPLSRLRADTALLIVAMRLMTIFPVDSDFDPKLPMYLAAKRMYAEAEALGILTLSFLQAGVLISIYEYGHAMYPATFFTIAACARYAALLGIDKERSLFEDPSLTWVEVEEKRRVWWAILIMDRCVNIGCPSRTLATNEPSLNSPLPVDDAVWEEAGDMPENILTLSTAASLEMGQLARFAQAAHLVGQVYRHVSDPARDWSFQDEEREQLQRTLLALANVSLVEEQTRRLSFCNQTSTCYSALLILQEPYLTDNDPMPILSGDGFHLISKPQAIAHNAFKIVENFASLSLEAISPFITHLLYKSVVFFAESHSSPEIQETLKAGLATLDTKWRAAGAYLDMLQARQTWYE